MTSIVNGDQLPAEETETWDSRPQVSENGEPGKKFPRLSIPVELMKHQYDVVVIGSGYGGGVAASRMARGGQSVCLLELGKEKWRK